MEYVYLPRIESPADLKKIPRTELPRVAEELRDYLISVISKVGGHLASSLGAVELTLALHYTFDAPRDKIVWDVGHQAYGHKVITGRRDRLPTIRQYGGISGFPARDESPYDTFNVAHAGTAISGALGMAVARDLKGEDFHVIAVVGDAGLTAGLELEGINNLGTLQKKVLVILNDNKMSISPNVGAIAGYLNRIVHGQAYHRLKQEVEKMILTVPRLGPRLLRLSKDLVESAKTKLIPGLVFEELGFDYVGPINGHSTEDLLTVLNKVKDSPKPTLLHIVTQKGKGYPHAEAHDEDRMHAVGVIDPATGLAGRPAGASWTQVFADELTAIGADRPQVVAITAAMLHPTGLGPFAARFPDRTFDVGMAEQHAVTSAAGLAMTGLHPVVAVYSTFLNRAFDQVLMDVALHQLPVTFVLDRAGITGPDGPSHHGMWDASWLPMVPGLRAAAPRDPGQLRTLLREAIDITDGPTVIRYPKATTAPDIPAVRQIGDLHVLREDPDAQVLLVSVGPLAGASLAAAGTLAALDLPVTVVDPRWITPLDPALLAMCARHQLVVAVEDTNVTGSLGSRLATAAAADGLATQVISLALPAQFLPHDSRDSLLRAHGLDPTGICAAVLARLPETPSSGISAAGQLGSAS